MQRSQSPRVVQGMTETRILTSSMLWASAIVASAIVGAPAFLTLIVLPSLATVSLLTTPRARARCYVKQ
jgi:hypothetical protein